MKWSKIINEWASFQAVLLIGACASLSRDYLLLQRNLHHDSYRVFHCKSNFVYHEVVQVDEVLLGDKLIISNHAYLQMLLDIVYLLTYTPVVIEPVQVGVVTYNEFFMELNLAFVKPGVLHDKQLASYICL